MKIEIDDILISNLLCDLIDEVVALKMREIINDNIHYPHPEDARYYKKLRKAARRILGHYTVLGED